MLQYIPQPGCHWQALINGLINWFLINIIQICQRICKLNSKNSLGICVIKNCIIELIVIKDALYKLFIPFCQTKRTKKHINQGCKNSVHQVTRETTLYAVAHYISMSTALNLPHITFLANNFFISRFLENTCTPRITVNFLLIYAEFACGIRSNVYIQRTKQL
jgi:hypothetical protein